MRKMLNKSVSLLLSVVMIFSVFSVGAFASGDYAEWQKYYADYEKTYGNAIMSPGSDETQRNFSWYSDKKTKYCKVVIAIDEDFTIEKEFNGTTKFILEGMNVNKVTVTGLKPGKRYYYKCVTNLGSSKVAYFDTLKDNTFNALYVTDIHVTYDEEVENPFAYCSYNVDRLLTDATARKKLDLVISAGDQGTSGLRSEYNALMASPKWANIPFALCVGNHDRKSFDYKYFNNNPNKYTKGVSSYIGEDYWYVKGNVLFMVFDSNCYAATTHRNFVKEAIKANPNVKWKVAVMHHDMYGIMSAKREKVAIESLRPIFGKIFDEFGFDFALLGHTHYYTRTNPVYDGKSTEITKGKDSVKDANGTIYMVSGSINHPRDFTNANEVFGENLSYYRASTNIVYNLMTFSDDSIKVEGYELGAKSAFNTFTVYKSSVNGGHTLKEQTTKDFWKNLGFEFESFFTELGIEIKIFFNIIDILQKQK